MSAKPENLNGGAADIIQFLNTPLPPELRKEPDAKVQRVRMHCWAVVAFEEILDDADDGTPEYDPADLSTVHFDITDGMMLGEHVKLGSRELEPGEVVAMSLAVRNDGTYFKDED